jgi:DNA-binding NtrC family response regulator
MSLSHILVVDDDQNSRDLLRRFLEPAGYEVHEADNAESAVRSIEEHPPAVALCDVHMPGANGLWLADQIRAASPATAMILATGDDAVSPVESLRSGVVAYLIKPLDRAKVLQAVKEGLQWSLQAEARGVRARRRGQLGPGRS